MENPHNKDCRRELMTLFATVIERVSPYAAAFKHLKQVETEQQQIAEDTDSIPLTVTMYYNVERTRGDTMNLAVMKLLLFFLASVSSAEAAVIGLATGLSHWCSCLQEVQ